jgi:hypothetical protein
MMFLRLHHQEILAAEIRWGLWLFPLAILVYRSRFLPRGDCCLSYLPHSLAGSQAV